ncbi:hypothetical protein OOU_Y34scaffold00459g1 [Pyricularia oryzae Y34]|uniref:Uncharacterized protein n=2 Tax=Pyricularia oryzae TaxID=318829 RepID=A0AA97PML2_PYRO3|nr:hypothetical protein OOU_Y34scaffold00459g1 [Pyricularia oryzae Y34]
MKFSATLLTAIATTSVQALWFVPSSHSENKHQLREYLTTPAGSGNGIDGRRPHNGNIAKYRNDTPWSCTDVLNKLGSLKDFATEEHGVDVSKQCCERATFPEVGATAGHFGNLACNYTTNAGVAKLSQPALLCREQPAPDDDQLGHDNRVRDIKIWTLKRGTLLKKKKAKAVLIRLGYKK